MSIVALDHLTKVYKNGRGIRDLSLRIEKGQIVGLLGPNGSGKTTTMKIMTGLLRPDSGKAILFGADPSEDMEKAMQNVGCLIEAPSYYPYLTAKQNLEIIGKLYPSCSLARTEHVLDQVGLSAYANEKVSKFSSGMKQRLGLAMTLLSEPELLILDEPTNGLDIQGMTDVRGLIQDQARKGRTVLLSSHLAFEIQQVCTHVVVIQEGELIGTAKVSELLVEYGSVENYYLALTGKKKEMAS